MNIIKFEFSSNLMMVNVDLWNNKNNKFDNILITFDTGASMTVISKEILNLLGYELGHEKSNRIITASDVEFVEEVNLKKIKIGSTIINNVNVYAHNFPESSFSLGVLGLNFLKNFDIKILFSKNELHLKKIKSGGD